MTAFEISGRLTYEQMAKAYGTACRQAALAEKRKREAEAELEVAIGERDALLAEVEGLRERCPSCGDERV